MKNKVDVIYDLYLHNLICSFNFTIKFSNANEEKINKVKEYVIENTDNK